MDFLGPNKRISPSRNWRVRWFREVEVLTTASSKAALPKLDATFSRQGIPEVLKSDNGPSFNGAEFESYAKHCGFIHRKTTPH